MMRTLLMVAIVGVGCAHSAPPSGEKLSTGGPELAFHESLHQLATVRFASDAELSADFRVCVAPSGRAASVSIARSSGVPGFDRIAQGDLGKAKWKSFVAPPQTRVCALLEVVASH